MPIAMAKAMTTAEGRHDGATEGPGRREGGSYQAAYQTEDPGKVTNDRASSVKQINHKRRKQGLERVCGTQGTTSYE